MKSVEELYEEVRQKQKQKQEEKQKPDEFTEALFKYIEKAVCKAVEENLTSIELSIRLPNLYMLRTGRVYFYTRYLDVDREMEERIAQTLLFHFISDNIKKFKDIETILNNNKELLGYKEAKLSIDDESVIETNLTLFLCWDEQ